MHSSIFLLIFYLTCSTSLEYRLENRRKISELTPNVEQISMASDEMMTIVKNNGNKKVSISTLYGK
jgi:hypothetical protein